ncbi:DUF7079 family protein [Novipirellula sp. SH528]|uniref:DUF7079 family protein n=1 Tax=Novipirellula sp. SH528 TaxID=3454466 RepID=UPI003F9FDA91
MTPADQDIENRRPVWRALSDLFLDTELQDHDLSCIARSLAESPYTASEIETILFREVYPVCIANLTCVAGEWAGFDDAWLEASILKHARRRWTLANIVQLNRWMIRDDWNRVKVLYYEQWGVPHTHGLELKAFPDLPQ